MIRCSYGPGMLSVSGLHSFSSFFFLSFSLYFPLFSSRYHISITRVGNIGQLKVSPANTEDLLSPPTTVTDASPPGFSKMDLLPTDVLWIGEWVGVQVPQNCCCGPNESDGFLSANKNYHWRCNSDMMLLSLSQVVHHKGGMIIWRLAHSLAAYTPSQ